MAAPSQADLAWGGLLKPFFATSQEAVRRAKKARGAARGLDGRAYSREPPTSSRAGRGRTNEQIGTQRKHVRSRRDDWSPEKSWRPSPGTPVGQRTRPPCPSPQQRALHRQLASSLQRSR